MKQNLKKVTLRKDLQLKILNQLQNYNQKTVIVTVFNNLNTAFTIIGCIVNSLLQPEKLDELCNKLDGYLTKNEPFGGAWDIFWNIKFITDGCKINLGKAIIFLGVLTQIYNILLAKIYKYINS